MINLNKKISALISITIIVILAGLLAGGILIYQYYLILKQEFKIPEIKKAGDETAEWEIYNTATIYFSDEIKGIIYLKSPDIEVETIEAPSCAGLIGSKEYIGDFSLIFNDSKLELGELSFIDNSYHNGELIIQKLNPNSNQDFILFLQYGTCNYERVRFYGYDFQKQGLIKYSFKRKNGNVLEEISVNPQDNFLEILPSKDFISKVYDNSIGKNRIVKWRFNNEENIFEEIDSWLEEM